MEIYTVNNIKKIIKNPSLIFKAAKIAGLDINRHWYKYRYGFSEYDIFSEDWDNLILIDAARYDFFKELSPFPKDRIELKQSPGSFSLGFMEKMYFGRELHDTVYVTCNPYTNKIPDGTFHATINLLNERWNDKLGTVLPRAVIDSASDIQNRFSDKKMIVHFMQPHYPFIGEKGKQINSGFETDVNNDQSNNPWNDQMWGDEYDHDLLIEAYKENHEIAIKAAIELANELTGKSVITSDHANLIGERGFPIPIKMYGHPRDFPHPNLLKVPWVELEDTRRKITTDPPIKSQEIDESTVDDRLEALGYK